MAATFTTAHSEAVTLIEALTPPDKTTITYHNVDGIRKFLGNRVFYFGFPSRLEPALHAGTGQTLVAWSVSIFLRLSQAGRSHDGFVDVVANEANLITRAINTKTDWSAGIYFVEASEAIAEEDESDGDVVIEFILRIECGETD